MIDVQFKDFVEILSGNGFLAQSEVSHTHHKVAMYKVPDLQVLIPDK